MIVRLFKPQFAPMVRDHQKRQTVRPWPKRLPKVGEPISLRQWSGAPYRSKQTVLLESTVTKIERILITADAMLKEGYPMDRNEMREFAHEDGFENLAAFFRWFDETHALPFAGIVIYWK